MSGDLVVSEEEFRAFFGFHAWTGVPMNVAYMTRGTFEKIPDHWWPDDVRVIDAADRETVLRERKTSL